MTDSNNINTPDNQENQDNQDNQDSQDYYDYYEEETVLPRSGWTSKKAHLIAILKAKRALDRIEKEAFG
jgi:hypothetical protein